VLSDLAVLTIAQRPPRTRQQLEKLRGVDARSLAKGAAAEILEAVDRGTALGQDELRLPPDAAESKASPVAVAMCGGLVRQIAEQLEFDQSLLATRSDIALLVVGEPSRLDLGWRHDLAGSPIRRLLSGEVAVAFDTDGQLVLEARSHMPARSGPAA
jgi:ribonuclease D